MVTHIIWDILLISFRGKAHRQKFVTGRPLQRELEGLSDVRYVCHIQKSAAFHFRDS